MDKTRDNKSIAAKAVGAGTELENSIKGLINTWKHQYDGWGNATRGAMDLSKAFVSLVKPFAKVQDSAIELAKATGIAGSSVMAMSKRMVAANKQLSLSMNYGISNQEMMRIQTTVMSKLGRNVAFDLTGGLNKNERGEIVNPNAAEDSEIENIVAASKILTPEGVADIIAGFDRVGKSMTTASKYVGKLFKEAGENGINFQKYSQNFVNNLGMAQTYNFRRGVDGLKEMARKATAIRQDMSEVARFADKVGSVTGAVETAANLQVLGGSFATMASPLAMLNESLTDVEALQARLNKMTEGAAHYDAETHEIRMNPYERERIKAAAQAAGLDASAMIDKAYAQERKRVIKTQLDNAGIGNMSDKIKELISNVGEINDMGTAGATIKGTFYTAGEIAASPNLQKELVIESAEDTDNVKEIAKRVISIDEYLRGVEGQVENELAINNIKPGIIDGRSMWEEITSTIVGSFTPQVVAALGRMDFVPKSFGVTLGGSLSKAFADIAIAPLGEDTFEEWKAKFEEGFDKNVGEGIIQTAVKNAGTSAAKFLDEWSHKFNDAIKGYGINITDATKSRGPSLDNKTDLNPGSNNDDVQVAKGTIKDTGNNAAITRDITNTTIKPVDGTQIARAAQHITNESVDVVGASRLAGLYGDFVDSILPSRQETNHTQFKENEKTIPEATVTPTGGTEKQTGNGTQQQTVMVSDINVHFDGTIKVNGDKGNICEADFKNMLENNESFKQEIAKALSDALERINKQQ